MPQQLMTQGRGDADGDLRRRGVHGCELYIGNAPNFMVYAIAREGGVRMPSFFGYMLWSGTILLPVFLLTTLVFF